MASFVNFNNRQETSNNKYSVHVVKEALRRIETKNNKKINDLTKDLNKEVSLNEALLLFTDKLGAMSMLSGLKLQSVNEGQFSWMTQDSGEQIGSEKENTIDVWMYDNQGNVWYEKRYEGYGEFGGMDYYELVATMNGYTEEDLEAVKGPFKELRQLGIDLAFGKLKTKDKKGKTLFPALVTDPRYNWKRHDFTQEAESDPNQSWYQEPEYDDYEDDYDSDEYYESAKANIKFHKTITKKEWDKAQKDSKTIIDGTHYMMFLDDDKGTILAPVEVTESEDKEVNEGLPDSFLGLPLETFADYYNALDVAIGIGVSGIIAGAVLAKLGLDAGAKLFKKGKAAVEDWYAKNGGEVTEGNAFGAARAEAIAKGEKEFTVDGETYPVENVDKEDKENAEEFANEGTVNENWGTFGTPEAKVVIKTLNKALAKFEADLKKAHDTYQAAIKEFTTGAKQEIGNKSGFNDSEGKYAVHGYTMAAIEKALNMKEWGGSLDYKVGWMYEGQELNDITVNESMWVMIDNYDKSVDLRKDLDKAFDRLEKVVGKEYEKFVDTVKNYTTGREAEYGKEAGFDKWQGKSGVKMAIEGMLIRIFDLDPRSGKYSADWMFEGVSGLNWNSLKEALGISEGRSIGKIQKEWGAVTLDMKQTVEEWKAAEGDRKTELLDKLKALTSQKKALESELNDAVGLKDADAELEESDKKKVETLSESLRSDLKKYIAKHEDELNILADEDNWDQLYSKLFTDFDVEADSKKAEELKQAFDLTF